VPSSPRPRLLPFLCLLLAAGCGGTEPPAEEPPTALPTWSLVEELSIGREDDPNYALTPVRGLAVGPDQVYVTLHQEAHVRVFDHDGRFVRTIGRFGEGPGEFGYIGQPGVMGDTLWVSDGRGQGWMHYFTLDGTLLRGHPLPGVDAPYISVVGGDQPIRGGGFLRATSTATARNPDILDFPIFRTDAEGVTVGALPGRSSMGGHLIVDYEARMGSLVVPQQHVVFRPFNVNALYGFGPDGRYVIRVEHEPGGDGVRVLRVGTDGDTLATSYVPLRRQRVPQQVRDSVYDVHLETLTRRLDSPARARRELAALDIPTEYPAMRRTFVDRDHRVWIEPNGDPEQPWLLLDAELQPLAHVRVPPRHDYLVAAGTTLWAIRLGDYDVPYIVRYRIVPD